MPSKDITLKLNHATLLFTRKGIFNITTGTPTQIRIGVAPHETLVTYQGVFTDALDNEYLLVECNEATVDWFPPINYIFKIEYNATGGEVEFKEVKLETLLDQMHHNYAHVSVEYIPNELMNRKCRSAASMHFTYNTECNRSNFASLHEWIMHPETHVGLDETCMKLTMRKSDRLIVTAHLKTHQSNQFKILGFVNVKNIKHIRKTYDYLWGSNSESGNEWDEQECNEWDEQECNEWDSDA